ncbi:ATP-binding protein [Kutzneria sp. CA-103260]|uniref:ATP-binding protein n=1 Tax=Kutzneria sp. CA-103260 TaxID=2802641 RepID=UPI001BA59671|nr:tetratricopeptide repeat protein [Kutzneria sp. CA-103260]QUQ68307.1 ATPase [Kutzneria sp. CA-103260]
MRTTRTAVHRTILAVDVEKYGDPRRTNPHRVTVREGVYRALQAAFAHADVPWADCDHADQGDGVFVLAPPDIPKALFVESVPAMVATMLREHNAAHLTEERIRLRMVVHAGEVTYDAHGLASNAVNHAFRLLDAGPVKTALAASPGVLALIASSWFFDEVVRHTTVVDAATFRPVRVVAKETNTVGWIALPDHPFPAEPARLLSPPQDAVAAMPQQLPAAPCGFTGRDAELATLTTTLDGEAVQAGVVVVSAIGGAGGIGKTWLALHWAHRHLDRFPDGQLYANLRGFDPSGSPASPAHVVRDFLGALGVEPTAMPVSVDAQSALYRSLVAGRRMLILLDNVANTDQVVPLLPGSPTCTVVVTSRHRLTGLIATHGARPLEVDVLTDSQARDLLAARLGAQRLAAEPDAVTELVACCGGYPLALSVVAARALSAPGLSCLATLAAELQDTGTRLGALDTGDDSGSNVRAVFSWSYDALSPAAARMFRLLGLHDGADISRHAAGALADLTTQEAQQQLDELTRAHLLESKKDGRYQFHDLLRVYALERATSAERAQDRTDAVGRVIRWYLHAANLVDKKMIPHKPIHDIVEPPEHWSFPIPTDPADARAWFAAEETNLIAAVRRAVELEDHSTAWRLPQTMSSFWYVHNKRWDLWAEMLRISLDHARLDGSASGQACAYSSLGIISNDLHRYDEAAEYYLNAIELFGGPQDRWQEGITYNALGNTYVSLRRFEDAMWALDKAAEVFEAIGSRFGRAWALQGTASAYEAMGEHKVALDYARRALAAWSEIEYVHGVGSGLNLLGQIHCALGRYEQAVDYFDQAVQTRQSTNDQFGVAVTLQNRAAAHLGCGQTEQARQSLRTALPILERLGADEINKVSAQLAQLDEH